MNKEIKDKWLKALRSGEYKQGQNYLKQNCEVYRYCCMGVLVDIGLEGEWREILSSGRYKFYPAGENEDGRTFHEFINGQEYLDKLSITMEQQKALANMNDDGIPFWQIADWIEENL
jgi:hypothetical protein